MEMTSHYDFYVSARILNCVHLRVGVVILHMLVLLGTDKAAVVAHTSTEVMILRYNDGAYNLDQHRRRHLSVF